VKTEHHVLEALRAIASKSWHGNGCHKKNCGTVCLCAPCHARVALEQMNNPLGVIIVEQAEQDMTARTVRGRWRILSKTSPSGKTLFVCLSCGNTSPTPQPHCIEPVQVFNGEKRACRDWKPSPFEVQ
jgi:hypothetical protein